MSLTREKTYWNGNTTLTQREVEVLTEASFGHTNQQIADKLELSVDTVKRHMQWINIKLDANTRAGAVGRAFQQGILR